MMNIRQSAAVLLGLLSVGGTAAFPLVLTAAPTSPSGPAGDLKLRDHSEEDWTTPRLSTTHLTPIKPLVAETDDRPKFTRELVEVGWRPLDAFHLYVIKPKGVLKPPVVLYLYNYTNNTKRFQNDGYCERITRSGCAAVGFESALSGDRFQMRPMRQWFVSELPEALSSSAHDVQMILNYLGTRGDLDMTRVGMFGQGSGGAIAILAAGADPRIKAVDLLNPWGDWSQWLQKSWIIPDADRPQLTQTDFERKVLPLEPVTWLPRLASRKIRIMQVTNDSSIPTVCQDALAKSAPSGAQVIRYADNLAMFGAVGQGRLFDWLGQQLHTRPGSVPVATVPPNK